MAILRAPSSSSATKPSALHLFTNRESERTILSRFFTELADSRLFPERPVLSFYGVGGIGKSLLLKKATEELKQSESKLHLVVLDVDHDRWKPTSSVADFFWYLREQLAWPTPLFDHLYFTLWRSQHPGENFNLQDNVLKSLLQSYGEGANLISNATGYFQSGGIVGNIAHFLGKATTALRDRARRAGLEGLGIVPEELTAKAMEEVLAGVLHHDLAARLREKPDASLCIAVDGFERIQSTVFAEDIQRFFAAFCGYGTDPQAEFRGRLGVLLLGREHLRWNELYDEEWTTRIDSHCLEGISEVDARDFFQRAADYHCQQGETQLTALLSRHTAALLAATCEQRQDEQPASHHPYYLDLAYSLVRDRREAFQPADLGSTPRELQSRFLRYLQTGHPEVFQAFQCLALAGTFDEELFRALVHSGFVSGGLYFAALVGDDYSYVDEVPATPGVHRFHRLMERALLETQRVKPENLDAAYQRTETILKHFVARGAFDQMADCGPRQLAAYRQGMTILFDRYADGFLTIDTLTSYFDELDSPFHLGIFANLRVVWAEKLLKTLEETKGVDHSSTLIIAGHVAFLLQSRNDLAKAESLYRRILETQEHTLGPEHLDTLRSVNCLGTLLHARGKLAEAEPLLRRALESQIRTLGSEHAYTLSSTSNLATLLRDKGDLAEAEQMYWSVAETLKRTLDAEDPYLLLSITNLATLLHDKDNLADAEALLRYVTEAQERTLGPEHPHTLTSINNLASVLHHKGDLVDAEILHRRALEVYERTLGPEHRDTLRSVNNLAGVLHDKGDLVNAEVLCRRILESHERTLGPEHPHTLLSFDNLVTLLLNKGDLAGAKLLSERLE